MSLSLEELLAELVARGSAVESEPVPTNASGEELMCFECEFEAESIEQLECHKEEAGH
jgi:hypothetical protein